MPNGEANDGESSEALDMTLSLLEALPGEIRNQIFSFCIANALKPTKATAMSSTIPANDNELSVLPQWHGRTRVRMRGMGHLPLLLVSKRIYADLGSLVYSNVNKLCIGGYILQHSNEDPASPSSNWNCIYPALSNPYLKQFIHSIKLKLPSARDDLRNKYDSARGFSVTGFPTSHKKSSLSSTDDMMSVVPRLHDLLKQYLDLKHIEIVISVEMREPPDFQPLLSLYDLCCAGTSVTFEDPVWYSRSDYQTTWYTWTIKWAQKWNECLRMREVEAG